MFQTFAPSAIRPPSAKNRHWIVRITIMDKNPAHGPSTDVSSRPPQRWPDEPVPGMV